MPQHLPLVSLLCIAGMCIGGCESSVKNEARLDELSAEVQRLKDELDTVKVAAELNEGRLEQAERDVKQNASSNLVEFDPSESHFLRLDGPLTTFAVSIEDVRQFADGVRVTLNLGNLSSATYSGATLHLEYGPRVPAIAELKNFKATGDWLKSLQKRQETITAKLLPGSWNPVKVTLPKIEQGKFGYLSVRIHTNEISLR